MGRASKSSVWRDRRDERLIARGFASYQDILDHCCFACVLGKAAADGGRQKGGPAG